MMTVEVAQTLDSEDAAGHSAMIAEVLLFRFGSAVPIWLGVRDSTAPGFDEAQHPPYTGCTQRLTPEAGATLLSSSMAEHPAVNRRVVGSSPT